MKYLSRTVWILSAVSLLTDAASEMLYPVMPVYLKKIGFSILLIGILEGLAEATAGLSKGYFGKRSDISGRRVPFVQMGYALSAISKPMMAFFTFPFWIFFVRTIDRFGKGIRTGARDAMLSDATTAENKGKVFGFHRSMDTLGAVIGPLLALIYLHFYPENYTTLFAIAFLPGLLAVAASFFLREEKVTPAATTPIRISFFSFFRYWKESPTAYRKLVLGLLVFTLFNSSDVFLLLKAKESGLQDTTIIGIYIFYNLVYAVMAFPMGILADKVGLKTVFIIGLFIFAIVYAGMSFNTGIYGFIGLFALYGVYAAATEGISKAWISNICETKDTATAIGSYTGWQSICTMLASSLTGFIWYQWNGITAFLCTAAISILVACYMITLPSPDERI